MIRHITPALILSSCVTLFAGNSPKTETFEANFLSGRGTGDLSGYDWLGASVAGGVRHGNHLLQLEVAALKGESFDSSSIGLHPLHSNQLVFDDSESRLESIPFWANYRYVVTFGEKDRFRLDAGPTLGARIMRIYTEGRVRSYDVNTGSTVTDRGYEDASGVAVFDYGIGINFAWQIDDHWAAKFGYRHIRSTAAKFKHENDALGEYDASGHWIVYRQIEIEAHGTNYFSVGLEYTF